MAARTSIAGHFGRQHAKFMSCFTLAYASAILDHTRHTYHIQHLPSRCKASREYSRREPVLEWRQRGFDDFIMCIDDIDEPKRPVNDL